MAAAERAVAKEPIDPTIQDDGAAGTIRPFLAFLQEHREGALHDEVSIALNQLVEAVRGVGKKGTLTVVVEVKPAGRAHDQVFVLDDVKVKLPEPDREEKIMFVDKNGNLSRSNPLQAELPGLRQVPGRDNNEPKEVIA